VSVHCWGLISYEVAGIFCCTEEHEGLHYQRNINNDGALYKTALS
jgi:hypothetical protein